MVEVKVWPSDKRQNHTAFALFLLDVRMLKTVKPLLRLLSNSYCWQPWPRRFSGYPWESNFVETALQRTSECFSNQMLANAIKSHNSCSFLDLLFSNPITLWRFFNVDEELYGHAQWPSWGKRLKTTENLEVCEAFWSKFKGFIIWHDLWGGKGFDISDWISGPGTSKWTRGISNPVKFHVRISRATFKELGSIKQIHSGNRLQIPSQKTHNSCSLASLFQNTQDIALC